MTSDFYHSSLEFPLRAIPATERRIPVTELMRSAYIRLLNLGTDAVRDRKQIKYIKICNFTAMTSILASVLYIGLSVAWAQPLWFIIVNTLCAASIGVLYLNKIGRVVVSRVLYMLITDTLLLLSPLILGPETYGIHFLRLAILIPFLMWDIKNLKIIIPGVVTPVVFIIFYPYLEPFFAAYHLSIERQHLLYILGMPMQLGLGVSGLYLFAYYSRRTELELESSNQQMHAQTDELKRSNADLEQFAYVISHDLKTPVRNISCFMKLLATKHAASLDAEAREFVDFAVTGSKRMERLIDDVLAYSRIGRNLSTPTPVNVNDVINTIRYEIEGRIEKDVIIHISKELPIVNSAHSSLLYHIFQNLIRNGIKFNTSEHPEIHISWQDREDFYLFSVADNGIGISQQYAAQIFQMFKRLHGEHEYDGTGIGLAICKKIVEHYHGEIWYESDGINGTTFYFTIQK